MTERRDDQERPAFPLLFHEEEKLSVVERIRRALTRDEADDDGEVPTIVVPGRAPSRPTGETERRTETDTESASEPDPTPRAIPRDAGPVQRATIQLLPGRLVSEDAGLLDQEVRFLKTLGGGEVVTLGWDVAEPPEHVTLDHPSIRPRHARMTWEDDAWWIESLVPGDEVEVNDRAVPVDGAPRELANGDRLRLGDVRLRYVRS